MSEVPGAPITPEVRNAIRTIYGDNGVGFYEYRAARRPDASERQLIAYFQQSPCPQDSYLFRHGRYPDFISSVAPDLVAADGEVSITQIGATGEEAWSFAALLVDGSLPYRIAGYNVNQATLDRAYGPFNVSIEKLDGRTGHWLGRSLLAQCFEESTEGVRPRPLLTDHVSFDKHDILQGPVPGDMSNTVVINNVLWHYPLEARHHIMANILEGLRPGGVFIFEGWTRESNQAPGYEEWVHNLHDYGLWPVPRAVEVLLYYRPEEAIKTFERSPEVTDALGVLAATQQ